MPMSVIPLPSGGQAPDIVRDRAIRLFAFLREHTQLRTTSVRTTDSYEEVLWLADVPHLPGCHCAAFGPAAREGDAWIEVSQPHLAPPPLPPQELWPWLEPGGLDDSSLGAPPVVESIPAPGESEPPAEAEPPAETRPTGLIRFDERPELQAAYNKYVERRWLPWAEQDRVLRRQHRVYTDLFRLYQSQQQLGEAYEVVLGFGHLAWRRGGSSTVRRHLVVAQTDVRFDARRGVITVTAAVDGARPALEQDMLEPSERPPAEEVERIGSLLAEVGDDVFSDESVAYCLESWVVAASSVGRYEAELERQRDATDRPVVHLAPALILRSRTQRPILRALDAVADQLKRGMSVPEGVRHLVDMDEIGGPGEELRRESGGPPDEEILFPLVANEEQRDIVRRLRGRSGVLVQGPPGTGKTHTIANLVAHLLAQGQRVLVTSHTARALRVLQEKIPEEIRELVVLVLGNDIGGRDDLRTSVRGILRRHDAWDAERSAELVSALRHELAEARRAEASTVSRLRALRERDSHRYPRCFGGYEGTVQEIAGELRQRAGEYDWIEGDGDDAETDCPLSAVEALELLNLLRQRDPATEEELRLAVPELADLLGPDAFAGWVEEEQAAMRATAEFAQYREDATYEAMRSAPAQTRDALRSALNELAQARAVFDRDLGSWTAAAVDQVLQGDIDRWRELERFTSEVLVSVQPVMAAALAAVTGVGSRDLAAVLADARALLDHVRQGGGLGRGPLRPPVVKHAWYVIQNVRLDGTECREADVLERLVACLNAHVELDRLDMEWQAVLPVPTGSPVARAAAYADALASLRAVLGLEARVAAVGAAAASVPGLSSPEWRDPGALGRLQGAVEAGHSDVVAAEISARFKACEQTLEAAATLFGSHPFVRTMLGAIADRDVPRYRDSHDALLALDERRRQRRRRDALLGRLQDRAPGLAASLQAEPSDARWDGRLAALPAAWDWGRANRWLRRLADPDELSRLEWELDATRRDFEAATRKLAAELAWSHTMRRLTEWESVHLKTWEIAVRGIGNGTGRDAPVWRRKARDAMEVGRSAVPAWIMPIFKVAETVDLVPEAFDVVIVDEASQSGPEALFLHFLARKVIVVGDDQQISPDNASVDRGQLDLLNAQYLGDVPLGEFYNSENSFFDLAWIRYRDRITLREHFRCMPEIIQFSNHLCYGEHPLVPVKQYGAGRLTPVIQVRHVPDGYTIPGNVNQPEAEALADQVVACVRDPAYEGRTFGVISLVGINQAKHIERLLAEQIEPSEIERRAIVCGDAYAFQGDERDVIFLSLVQAARDGHRLGALASDADKWRINVAASRAKEQTWLFHTATLQDLNPLGMPHRLLQYCIRPWVEPASTRSLDLESLRQRVDEHEGKEEAPAPFESWLEVAVFLRLSDRGYRVTPQYEMAGVRVDLLVEGFHSRLAVECDSDVWYGEETFDRDVYRERMLKRCGVGFVRVRGSAFEHDPDAALEPLWTELQAHGISPDGGSSDRAAQSSVT